MKELTGLVLNRRSPPERPHFSVLYRYRYKPLDAGADEIRLLRLKHGSGDDYIACEVVHTLVSQGFQSSVICLRRYRKHVFDQG